MIREEAIDIIINDVNTHTIREGIALNMAIKAPEQEPILDKIRTEIQFIKDKCLPNTIAEEYEQKRAAGSFRYYRQGIGRRE